MNISQFTIFSFIFAILLSSCSSDKDEISSKKDTEPQLYTRLVKEQTGIDFRNQVYETASFNYYKYQYLYVGGGVAVGDINKDGLDDIYFSATQFSNKLYLNKGDFKFEEITQPAGLLVGEGNKTGVTMVDINNDGYMDIFVCRTGAHNDPEKRTNKFFINNGDLTFTESAEKMGLKNACYTNHVTFFDYDNDGDLDLYLLNHPKDFTKESRPKVELINGVYRRITEPNDEFESDRLYKNNGDGTFADVSASAGIINRAFGLSVAIADINEDGFDDIFVANDYAEPDIIYINQGDGTFIDEYQTYFRHGSRNSMGSDFSDLNNDGLLDLVVLDMKAEDNRRQKALATTNIYEVYQNYVKMGFGHQVMRNMLHFNNGNQTFSDLGEIAGIAATDWSWSVLAGDYDNDGWRDLYITNGMRRDVTDLDFIRFIRPRLKKNISANANIYDILNVIPQEKIPNYFYKNNHDLTFKKVTIDWGIRDSSFSNGAAYADLDNDGDLDMIVNNIDEDAFVYRNDATEKTKNTYLQFKFEGSEQNINGLGTKVILTSNNQQQFQVLRPTRGYFSSMPYFLHFGTGSSTTIDKVEIIWHDGKMQTLTNVNTNQRLSIQYKNAAETYSKTQNLDKPLFKKADIAINHKHHENLEFVDFKREALLPHELSKEGPTLAVGDVDGDGKEDVFIGGASGSVGALYLQRDSFIKASTQPWETDIIQEDVGTLFFDADNDKDLDLYIVSGGNEFPQRNEAYQDRLYINDGSGNFTKSTNSLPIETSSGSCVKAADYDSDGDLDLFVGGRVLSNAYPYAPQSMILENKNGKFSDATATVSPNLAEIGMVKDAIWTDINGDKNVDLVIVGEWMPITIFINKGGKLIQDSKFNIQNSSGWWNTISVADMDNDGDLDLVAGNLGWNTRMKTYPDEPLEIAAKDFDKNTSIDALMSFYLDHQQYPIYQRDVLITQLPYLQRRFNQYNLYAKATTNQVFTDEEWTNALKLQVKTTSTTYFENTENGFKAHPLPRLAQISPTQSILLEDFDKDGNKDILLVGNFYYNEVETARYDAGNGLFLKGDGKGSFQPQMVNESGFFAAKDARDMKVLNCNGQKMIIVANNNDKVDVFQF